MHTYILTVIVSLMIVTKNLMDYVIEEFADFLIFTRAQAYGCFVVEGVLKTRAELLRLLPAMGLGMSNKM